MVFTNGGKNRLRDLFNDDLSQGKLGTGTTTATPLDTDLVSPISATAKTLTTTVADKQVIIDYNLGAGTAAGSTFTEYGIYGSDGTLFARAIFSSLVHDSTEQWQLSTRAFID